MTQHNENSSTENKTNQEEVRTTSDSFIKLDFLDTEKIRNIDYGTLSIRKKYHRYMAQGIIGAIGIFAIIFGSYLSYNWIYSKFEDGLATVRKKRILDVSELAPPPPLDKEKPPQPPPPIKPPEAPGIGEVKKVKDEEAPRQKTVADKELLKEALDKGAVEGDDTTGLAAAPIVDVPTEATSSDNLEDPPDFVPVEKDPDFAVKVTPEYPESARRLGLQGKVYLRVLVGKNGKAEKVQLLKSSGSDLFDESAKKALMKSTYTPAIQNGQPVRVWLSVPISFKLQQ